MGWVRGPRVWWCFVAMLGAALCAPSFNARADEIHDILTAKPVQRVADDRFMCASGITGQTTALLDKAFTSNTQASMADYCVAALVRLGREKQLNFLKNTDGSPPNAPLSFDTGFVAAYHKAEQIPANLPTVVVLRPIAVRCLEQTESDTDLCYSVGYAYGLRAAQGQQVVAY